MISCILIFQNLVPETTIWMVMNLNTAIHWHPYRTLAIWFQQKGRQFGRMDIRIQGSDIQFDIIWVETLYECYLYILNSNALILDRIQSSDTSDRSPTHLKRQKHRRKLGYLPMTTITSLDMPTEDELQGTSNHGK